MTLLLFVFIIILICGVPVFISLAGSSLLYTHFIAGIPDFVILHRMAGGIDSFPLLAVPFFILAGNLMNSAGITNLTRDMVTRNFKQAAKRGGPPCFAEDDKPSHHIG
jgi:TRAP-type mannitol/chloroaromatic compound transport system permease large subunit